MTPPQTPRSLLNRAIEDRDEAYYRMRELIPELDHAGVDRGALTDRQRAALLDYERLDVLVRRLRAQAGHHDHS